MKRFYERESLFQKSFLSKLRHVPHSSWEKISQRSKLGTPDIIGCVNGHYVALELKRTEADAPTEIQLVALRSVASARGTALVCHPKNAASILEFLCWLSGHGSGFHVDCFEQIVSRGDIRRCDDNDCDWQVIPLSDGG